MITAASAAIASKEQLDKMTSELGASLQKVITAAIQQGSCKATFYPRNQFEATNAMNMLSEYGYAAAAHPAKDQRDNDRIEIAWS